MIAALPVALGLSAATLDIGNDSSKAHAEVFPDGLFARIIDVGAGHCSVVRIPGVGSDAHYVVYDAGNYKDKGASCIKGISEVIPEGESIDLMVLSHSDADHIGGVDKILGAYRAERILWTGEERNTETFRKAETAMREATSDYDTRLINLEFFEYPHGGTYRFGDAFVTFVAGWHEVPGDWDIVTSSEAHNAISIVLRVQYEGRSILFTGDTVGRHIRDPEDACLAAEEVMVDNAAGIPIDSDVLVAPHHGADNGSSTCFIEAVSPEFVIFPAGHEYEHPRAATADRYLANGLTASTMFRTDLGDDEGDDEWDQGRINGHRDPVGDDDVDIVIQRTGEIEVKYRTRDL